MMHEDEYCDKCGQLQKPMDEEEYKDGKEYTGSELKRGEEDMDYNDEEKPDKMGEKGEVLESLLKMLNGDQTASRIDVLIAKRKKKDNPGHDNPGHGKKKKYKGGY